VSCKLSYVLRDVCKFASIYTLAALSLDRCVARFIASRHSALSLSQGGARRHLGRLPPRLNAIPRLRRDRTQARQQLHIVPSRMAPATRRPMDLVPVPVRISISGGRHPGAYAILFRRLRRITCRSGATNVARPSRRMLRTVLVVVVAFVACQTPYYVMQWIALPKHSSAFSQNGLRYRRVMASC